MTRREFVKSMGSGVALAALGWTLVPVIPMIKHIYTFTFTAQAMGWSALLYALFYILTDIWKLRRGLGVCILFGQFALTAYLLEEYLRPATEKFASMFVSGVPNLIGTVDYQPLVVSLFVVAEIIAVLVIRRKLKARS